MISNKLLKEYLQWDVATWSVALRCWEDFLEGMPVKTALELGARDGGLSLWMAQKGMNVLCTDLTDDFKNAQELHGKYGVRHLVNYEMMDATQIPFQNHFDLVVFKSILGGVGYNDNFSQQKRAFESIYNALRPGGVLLFADNLVASPFHGFLRRRFIRWGSSWRYVTLTEMNSFLSPFSDSSIKSTGFCAAFGRSEKQRSMLHFFDRFLFNPLVPHDWNYLVYGHAVK